MDSTEALMIMARTVSEKQDCVLEVLMGEAGMIAHLIPINAWEGDYEEGDED